MTDPQTIELTQTEVRIIELTAEGLTTKEMVERFYMGKEATVDTQRCRLYKKLNVRNAPHLISWAYKNKILNVEI